VNTSPVKPVPLVALLLVLLVVGVGAGPVAAQDAAAGAAATAPVLKASGSLGELRVLDAAGVARPLDALAIGDTIVTGADGRVAVSIARAPETRAEEWDVLLLGPNSKVTFTRAPAEAPEGTEPVVATLERGVFQAVAKHPSGHCAFSLSAGGRPMHLYGAMVLGRYGPDTDDARYLVLSNAIMIEAGSRKVRLRQGMARRIESGKIRAARKIDRAEREAIIGETIVTGVDLTQPVLAKAAGEGAARPATPPPAPSGATASGPKPWEYDPATDRHWNPEHGHWHGGPPPPGKGAPVAGADAKSKSQPGLGAQAPPPAIANVEPVYVRMKTSMGDILLELDAGRAPITVANFLGYVDSGFYPGTTFHRVVHNFMIQGGGFTADVARRAPTQPDIKNEWRNGLSNVRGTVAMARIGGRPDSANSQFFINLVDNKQLDRPQPDGAAYAVFGRVVGGMDVVDAIRAVSVHRKSPQHKHVPNEPVLIDGVERISQAEARAASAGGGSD
jgi:cyclophilin family peptidyl-prolyl cis-trans isomerase